MKNVTGTQLSLGARSTEPETEKPIKIAFKLKKLSR